jgi:hypothetical protein
MDLLGVLESRPVQQLDRVRQCLGALERWMGDIVHQHFGGHVHVPINDDREARITTTLPHDVMRQPFLFNNFHGGQLGVNLDQGTGQPRDLIRWYSTVHEVGIAVQGGL